MIYIIFGKSEYINLKKYKELKKDMSRLPSLQSYNRRIPLMNNGTSCYLIVDPQTYQEISEILQSVSYLQPYILSEEEIIEPRDINEIVDVINHAIRQGLTPYYWSRTQNRYLPITRAIRITWYNPGLSKKYTIYSVELEVFGVYREVNLNNICSIQGVNL